MNEKKLHCIKVLVFIMTISLPVLLLVSCSGGGGGGGNQQPSSPVLQSISISPDTIQLDYGSTFQLKVAGTYSDGSTEDVTNAVSWEIDHDMLVVIDRNGVLTSKSLPWKIKDETQVTAKYEDLTAKITVTVRAVLSTIEIDPSNLYLPPLWYGKYFASANYNNGVIEDITDNVEWFVDDSSLAMIGNENDSKGIVFTLQQGNTSVTASYASYSDTADLTVMPVRTLDGEGEMFEPPNSFMSSPQVDINGQGEIFLAWRFQGSGEIFTSGYRLDEGWLADEEIDKGSVENSVHALNIDINDNGDKLIVWTGYEGIYAAYCESGSEFVEPIKLDDTNAVTNCHAALDSDGNILVAWVDVVLGGPTDRHVYSSHYDHGIGEWSPPEDIGRRGYSGGAMAFASNARGDAVLLWSHAEYDIEGWTLFASRYFDSNEPNAGWQDPVELDVATAYYRKSVAINENGEIIATWCSATETGLYYSKFTPEVGWDAKDIIPPCTIYYSKYPQVSINEHGNAVVVYYVSGRTIHANRYDSVTGWSECENLRDANAGDPTILTPYIDEHGNIMALWKPEAFDALGGVEIRRYLMSEGWQDIEGLYYVGKMGNAYAIQNAFNSQGEGIIGWYEVLPIGYGSYNFVSTDLRF